MSGPAKPRCRPGDTDSPCGAATAEAFSLSASLNADELERLRSIVSFATVDPGETIIAEGAPADHQYIVNTGCVRLFKLLADGRRQITGFMFPWDLFGFAVGGRYAYGAEATTGSSLCRLPARDLEAVLDEFPSLEQRLLAVVSNDIAAAQDQMLLLGRKTARERVATFVLMAARRAHLKGHDRGQIDLPMTRNDIADYLGLTTETVSRCFTELRRDGVFDLEHDGRIVLVEDLAVLAEAASAGDDETQLN